MGVCRLGGFLAGFGHNVKKPVAQEGRNKAAPALNCALHMKGFRLYVKAWLVKFPASLV